MSVLIWMSKSQSQERENRKSSLWSHVLTCVRSGGIKQNSSGDYCQAEDHDTENGRIKAFINNQRKGQPLYLIIGASCHLQSTF